MFKTNPKGADIFFRACAQATQVGSHRNGCVPNPETVNQFALELLQESDMALDFFGEVLGVAENVHQAASGLMVLEVALFACYEDVYEAELAAARAPAGQQIIPGLFKQRA